MYGSGAVSCSCSLLIRGPNLARCQAEAPLIALCRFSKPALSTWEEEEELDELDVTTIERYRDRAQSQLTRGTYAKRSDNIKTASRKRMNRASGIKKANSRLNTFNNDGHDANTTNEGIGSAIGNMVKSLATSTV